MPTSFLKSDGFEAVGPEVPPEAITDESGFDFELNTMTSRLSAQFEAASLMHNKNIFTVRSAWESAEVYLDVALSQLWVTRREADILLKFYSSIKEYLIPPTAVIYMRTTKMAAFERMALSRKLVHEELYDKVSAAYEEFIGQVKVPVVEINTNEPFDVVMKNIEFGVSSLQSSRLSNQTIWSRSFFK